MRKTDILKKTLGFLTLAALSVSSVSCSDKPSEASPLPDEPVSEASEVPEIEKETENATEKQEETQAPKNNGERNYSKLFSDRDKNPDFSSVTADIILNGTAECNDSNVVIEGSTESSGTTVTIKKEGIYRLSGKLDNGQIIIDADKAKVQLILDNAEISSETSAPICGVDSDKIFISLAEGSKNKLTSNCEVSADDNSDAPDACIFSSDSLTLNGSGSLEILSQSGGIHSKDDIVITGGDISINAMNDGIKGKDYVAACGGKVDITCGQDGIKSTNAEDTSKGFVYIENGDFTVSSQLDGIQAESELVICGGSFDIISGGGHENSTKEHSDFGFGGFGGGKNPFGNFDPGNAQFGEDFDFGDMQPPEGFDPDKMPQMDKSDRRSPERTEDQQNDASEETDDDGDASTKGLKSAGDLVISGGNITIDSADDAFHANGSVEISGGEAVLSAGDDGIHADKSITVSGGNIDIETSYEGIEGAVITFDGGVTKLNSTDDGINASDGSSGGSMGNNTAGVELIINGGLLYVNADGDGLDSNGSITMKGGTVLVDGPTNGANGALDSNGTITVDGGILVAAGSAQMAEAPESSSAQCSLSATLDTRAEAGTLVTLTDESGTEIISFAPSKVFENIVISSPDIRKGQKYILSTGGSSASAADCGLYEIGGYNGDGTEVGTFTAEEAVSYIGERASMGGFGGGFDRGNKQPPTDENGEPASMPDKGDFGGKGGFGGRGGDHHGDKKPGDGAPPQGDAAPPHNNDIL